MKQGVFGILAGVWIFLSADSWAIEFYRAKEGANAREKASSSSPIIYRFKAGEEFKVLGKESEGWLTVRFSNHVTGYVRDTEAESVFSQTSESTRAAGQQEIFEERAQEAHGRGELKEPPEKVLKELRPSKTTRPRSSACEDGHWISSVSNNGGIVILEDNSVWEIDAVDTIDTALWLPIEEIVACSDRLINKDNGETANATPVTDSAKAPAVAQLSNTAEVLESQIEGDFEGWEGETVFKLANGQIWQQASYAYTYHYAYRPKIIIFSTTGGYKMVVEGVSDTIYVRRLR